MKIVDHVSVRSVVTSSSTITATSVALRVSAGEKASRFESRGTGARVVPTDTVNDLAPPRFRSSIPCLQTDCLVSYLLIP